MIEHPFRCPECPAPDDALAYVAVADDTGAYVCSGCGAWFPVEHGIVDFAPAGARDDERWEAFFARHGEALGVRAPATGERSANAQSQREFFDHTADDYEQSIADTSFWRAHDTLAIDAWVQRVPRDADVIDLGSGSGRCTVRLADRLDGSGMLVSTDLSFGMLRLAGEKLKARGTRDRVHLAVADSTRLGWLRSQRFDIAVSYALLHHLEQPEPVWAGLDRIMREHAHVLVQDNNASGMRTMFDWLMSRRLLWEAEHPDHPVIQLTDLHRWATQHGFAINARTSVFVPPHVCNSLSVRAARRLLASTDGVMSRVPIAARHGGLILAEAFRGGPPLVMGAQPRTLTYS